MVFDENSLPYRLRLAQGMAEREDFDAATTLARGGLEVAPALAPLQEAERTYTARLVALAEGMQLRPAQVESHRRRSGMFRSVTGTRGASQADYLLRGRVEHLEEVDSAGSVTARVGLRVELVEVKTRARVWTGQGAHEAQVTERSVEGVVRAMNESLRESLDQIVRGLAAHFQQHPSH